MWNNRQEINDRSPAGEQFFFINDILLKRKQNNKDKIYSKKKNYRYLLKQ